MATSVSILKETTIHPSAPPSEWTLWIQWCRYNFDDGTTQHGYRTIWRRPVAYDGGSLQAARGQARIPSLANLEALMKLARDQGWGEYDGDAIDAATAAAVAAA